MAAVGETLMRIAYEDFVEAESKIIENPSLLTQKDSNHRSILHWSAVTGKERLVEFLLQYPQCQIDEPDDTGATPLILATLKGSLPICKSLIERGADINHRNLNGHTPVKYAGSKNHSELLSFLLSCKDIDPNIRDQIGDTALHRVASMEHNECLRILLTNKTISIDAQNNLGNTALHLACECANECGALLLIEHGASTDILNKEGATPLDVCKPMLRKKIQDRLQKKN